MKRTLCTAFAFLAVAPSAALAQQPLRGPTGTSLNKVLLIGTDGTRWDLAEKAMKAGKAPNLARLRREGFGRPTTLLYGPHTLTLSEVGWSSIASGVWEDKHGVDGSELNKDPGQATKNGYLDFLTRIENSRPRLSTFLASDWDNIGLPLNGGPIFGSAMDANFAARIPAETIDNWTRGDVAVTDAATRYLRHSDPDAGFVYLGLVDETAHLAGSATPTYANAIASTDARIGRLLRAVRSRPTYPFESWTILVVTDHGQRPLSEPSPISHFGKTKLELTSFLFGTGPGLGRNVKKPLVVDILPTVLHQLGLATPRSWNIDGHTLSHAKPPSSATATLRGHRLTASLTLGSRPLAKAVTFRLPASVTGAGGMLVNGKPVGSVSEGRKLTASFRVAQRVRSISLAVTVGRGHGGSLGVTLRGVGTLVIPLS
jgi:Type I phosphodiesterase / nucleotide pyrophosphatase